MSKKLLIPLVKPSDAETVRAAGCEVLAEYPNSLLALATDKQQKSLESAGIETPELTDQAIQVSGARFAFATAVEANKSAPIPTDLQRTTYYIVKLIGPIKGEWLTAIKAAGAQIHVTLAGYALLVGMQPSVAETLKQQPWVEGISRYRPAMKISPELRPGLERDLTINHLAAVEAPTDPADRAQVEISIFPGESTEAVATEIRKSGGFVISSTPKVVTAIISRQTIIAVAGQEGVQSIIPHQFPHLHNDKAAAVMEAPADREFADITIRGDNQIIGIADTGLDSGDPATIQADFAGRVNQIVSWPNQYPQYSNDAPPYDDGPADTDPHGTHVAGSVLGNGANATAAGSSYVPMGIAPDAHVYFQAVEQTVNWKTRQQMIDAGYGDPGAPPNWPWNATGLYGLPWDDLTKLFDPAYQAGTRLHTDSWGASANGTYTTQANAVDDFLWFHRDMLILFSAGNDGEDANQDGIIDSGSMASPGSAKNCLTVGACENDRPHGSTPKPGFDCNWTDLKNPATGQTVWPKLSAAGHVSDKPDGMAAFSSRGPTQDSRIKPDVVAPGTNVLSTRSTAFTTGKPLWGDLQSSDPLYKKYCWSGGTSMATPLVAGLAALVRQHLVDQRGHATPSGALIKAFLVNGARMEPGQFSGEIPPPPAGTDTPAQNSVCGFGRVDAADSLTPGKLTRALFADDPSYAVETGTHNTFQVQVIDTAEPIKVTLVWTDAPAAAGTGGIVNQLYLRVKRPDGTFVNGDVAAYPTVSNNVQQVVIHAPVAGTYEIWVYGVSVTQSAPGVSPGPSGNPRQDFAVVVSNAMGMSLQPVSLAQAIDTTGSMDSFGYMDPTKERATQLTDFLRINDKLSITEFSHRTGVPDARTVYPLRALASFNPDWTDAHAAISFLHADGLTPIGAGLLEAWNQLKNEPSTRPRAIVLLSDGLNNVPPDPLMPQVLGQIPTDVPIFTVAMGPAGNTSALQQIAASRPKGQYFVVDGDEDVGKLHEIYAAIQALASGASLIGLSSLEVTTSAKKTISLPVEPNVFEVSFVLSWEGTPKELQFSMTGPDGKQYHAGTPGTLERLGSTYRIIRVAAPVVGTWTANIQLSSGDKLKCTFSAAAESTTHFAVGFEPKGDHLTVRARLSVAGKAVEGAELVTRVTLPTISQEEIMKKYSKQISSLKLPAAVNEKGLTSQQLQLTKLAVFAAKFRDKTGGLFGRKTVQMKMAAISQGVYEIDVPLSVGGNVSILVAAKAKANGVSLFRIAKASARCPEFVRKPAPVRTRLATKARRTLVEV